MPAITNKIRGGIPIVILLRCAAMKHDETPDIPRLRGPVTVSHLNLRMFLQPGDRAVDATCGNGGDTLLLAELVGPQGRVWGFDIQQQAITTTRQKLDDAGLGSQVELLQCGHEEIAYRIVGPLQAVTFNLGYLPGSDRAIITRPETTVTALRQSLELLAPGGIIAVTVYPGHSGGVIEQRSVDDWASGLDPRSCHVWRMSQLNVATDAPYFILVQRSF